MSNELDKAIGFQLDDVKVNWNTRDLLLYAIGIGAKSDELSLVYENDDNFSPFPTYPVVLNFKGENNDVVNFFEFASNSTSKVPGLPSMDPSRILHGAQYIKIHKLLPSNSSNNTYKLKRRIVGVHENPKGIVVETESILFNEKGDKYATTISSSFNIGAKTNNEGRKYSKSISNLNFNHDIPNRKPDYSVKEQTSKDQAIIYRLSGDYNPLHIDPNMASMAGFKSVILHGLSTYGIAARLIVNNVANGNQKSLQEFNCRFSSPVRPGDRLLLNIWKLNESDILFEMLNESNNNKLVLSKGFAKLSDDNNDDIKAVAKL